MYRARSRTRPLARRSLALAVAAACALSGAALAAISAAPTLRIKVPATVKPGERFKIYLYVTYDKKTTHNKPFIVSFVQFSTGACRSTGKEEHTLPLKDWMYDYVGPVTNSPFTRWDVWTGGTLRGTRRVCAYLYPRQVTDTSDLKPELTATATYRGV